MFNFDNVLIFNFDNVNKNLGILFTTFNILFTL